MTSYHGWTHAPKEQGGTDPIPSVIPEIAVIRRRKDANQAIATLGETIVTWGTTTVIDSSVFEVPSAPNQDRIRVLQDGLYGVSLRLYWPQWPDAHLGIINGVDPDAYAGYPIVNSNTFSQVANATGYHEFRLPANQSIYVTVHHQFGANRNLGVGTYIEVRRLGDITLDGRDSE